MGRPGRFPETAFRILSVVGEAGGATLTVTLSSPIGSVPGLFYLEGQDIAVSEVVGPVATFDTGGGLAPDAVWSCDVGCFVADSGPPQSAPFSGDVTIVPAP